MKEVTGIRTNPDKNWVKYRAAEITKEKEGSWSLGQKEASMLVSEGRQL